MRQHTRRNRNAGGLAILVALTLWAGPVHAQYSVFTNTAGGSFGTAANWDNGVPNIGTAFSNATFDLPTTYTVTLDATRTNSAVLITNTGQNITFDMGGFTYRANTANGIRIGTNNTDVITVTVSNGTLQVNEGTNWPLLLGGASTLIITNGGKVRSSQLNGSGNVLVSGAGSYLHGQEGGNFGLNGAGGTNIINDGAAAFFRNGSSSADLLLIDNATLTNSGHTFLTFSDNTMRIQNGGLVTALTGGGAMSLGLQAATGSRMIIGNTGAVSMVSEQAIYHEERYNSDRGEVDVIVSTNGVLQLRGGVANLSLMYSTNTGGNLGFAAFAGYTNDWKVQDNSIVTLRGGSIAMNTNTVLGLLDNNPNTTTLTSEAGGGILRGYGVISNYNAGANFKVINHGIIRPGDYGYEVGTHSNIVGLGTLSMIGGDLVMTNPLSQVGATIHFDFDPATAGVADLIDVTDGAILIGGGSNVFNNFTGATQLAFGTWDFLRANTLLYTPEFDNLTNIINGLTNTLPSVLFAGYSYGVVQDGDYSVLRLSVNMIPEPYTVLLLLGGGLLVWRLRKRQ